MSNWIIHFDANSFFASCEQMRNRKLRGQPLVVGKERGMAVAVSKEAKERGIKRGMRMDDILNLAPDTIIMPTDFALYSIVSQRMANIASWYGLEVERYSIDECFIKSPITYSKETENTIVEHARKLKQDIESSLDIKISVGIASNKVRAKMATRLAKSSGLFLAGYKKTDIFDYLPIGDLWGIGPSAQGELLACGIKTVGHFLKTPISLVASRFRSPVQAIWHELMDVLGVQNVYTSSLPLSIQRTRLLQSKTSDSMVVVGELARHAEDIGQSLNKYKLGALKCCILLRTLRGNINIPIALNEPVFSKEILIKMALLPINKLNLKNTIIIGTGVYVYDLLPKHEYVPSMFGVSEIESRWNLLSAHIENNPLLKTKVHSGAVFTKVQKHESKCINDTAFELGLIYTGEVLA